MAADMRRWGGYCRRTSSIAAVTLGASGATLSTSTCLPLANMAGHPQAGGHCRHLAGARLGLRMPRLCAGQQVPDNGGNGPPLVTWGGLGTLRPLHCLC